MPGQLKTRDFAARISELSPGMPILYASGYDADTISDQGVLEPGFAFIAKPLTPSTLVRKVREVLDSPRTAAASHDDFADLLHARVG